MKSFLLILYLYSSSYKAGSGGTVLIPDFTTFDRCAKAGQTIIAALPKSLGKHHLNGMDEFLCVEIEK